MKVQNDTGWFLFINKALGEKSVDKLEEIDPELSPYSSISTLTNVWSAKHLWRRKNRQKKPKRHRFPPSLLTSRAADFWKTLMPLRANCSCSSISVVDKCSSTSFGVSISDATFGSNSDSSITPIEETAEQKTLGDTSEHTHLAFQFFIDRMVRLLSILNHKSDSSSTHIGSSPNLKILPPPNSKSEKNMEMIARDSHCRIPSITSLSSNSSSNFKDHWSTGRTGKRWESLSKLEIVGPNRRGRGFFPSSSFVPKISRVPKSVLTKEELVYLLQYKKSLLSEYFQRKVDSTDLEENLDPTDRKSFIYETQSDSRLQEHNLIQFVEFIREKKQEDAEDVVKKSNDSLETQKSKSSLTFSNLEESQNSSTPKRRVTFSDPLAENTTSLTNCCSFINGDHGILSEQSFTAVITDKIAQEIQSDVFFDSKSVSPSDSSVSLKSCFADLSSKSLSKKATDQAIHKKYIADERRGSVQSESENEIMYQENSPRCDIFDVDMVVEEFQDAVSLTPVKNSEPGAIEDLKESLSSASSRSSQESNKPAAVIAEGVELIEEELHMGLKCLAKKILDCGTTHVPVLDYVGSSIILGVDNATPRVTFEKYSPRENSEEYLKRKISPMEIREDFNPHDDDHRGSNCEIQDESIGSKISRSGNTKKFEIPVEPDHQKLTQSSSKEQQFSDTSEECRSSLPSGKSVTFEDEKELQSSLQSGDKSISSSARNLKGRFEFSWKGCWQHQSTINFAQNARKIEENCTEDENQSIESNPTEISSDSVLLPNDREDSSVISDSQTSYYTTMEEEVQLANNFRSRQRRRNFRATSSSSYSHPSNNPSFMAVAASLESDDPIPWKINSKDDFSKQKLNRGFEPDQEAIKLQNLTELRMGLGNVYKGITNPEIWRSEVRSEPKNFSKSDWYTRHDFDKLYSWKKPEMQSDWLIRRLEELQSSPEIDYESDYYAESEIDSDFEYEKDLSPEKRSFSNLDAHFENRRKFKIQRSKFARNLFLNKLWPGRKVVFNECRCHKNTPRNRCDLKPKGKDLKHMACRESDQRSNQNFFSHLRARIILDSETDDSDFAPSIQSDFRYDFNRRDEYVNKIKCRRFVKSFRSINSEEDRQYSSARLLNVTFEKSVSPASVQSAFSTRTVGTNISEKQNFYNMVDVCIDTDDLRPHKPIETISNTDRSCQTVESSFATLNSKFESPIQVEKDSGSKSNPKTPISNKKTISNAPANLSNQINSGSNILAKSRFSEIKAEPEKVTLLSVAKGDDLSSTLPTRSSIPISSRFPPSVRISGSVQNRAGKTSNVPNNSDSYTVEDSPCPICNSDKKPTGRYVLPACIVKGAGPDSKSNEKDPWNRVMKQAKAQHRSEGRNTSFYSETKSSLERSLVTSSTCESVHSKTFERYQKSFASDQPRREEVRIQLVQVKNNSAQAAVCDLENPAVPKKPITLPCMRKDRPIRIPPAASALGSSTSTGFSIPNLTRMRSPGRNRKPHQTTPNMSNRLLYIISEKSEPNHIQMPMKSPLANFFT